MLTELQKKTAQAIVNIFETSRPQGEYGKVTLLSGDAGHLTYGRSQTTLASGNLHLLIKSYCEASSALHANALRPYLNRLKQRDLALDSDQTFRSLLARAGEDPVMHDVQDQFFDRVYWNPSVASAESIGIGSALGTSVVYDSTVHGSWRRLRDAVNSSFGLAAAIGERAWIQFYVRERRVWLATHENPILHATVYRMDAFQELMNSSNWHLALPIRVRGILIDERVFTDSGPVRASAHDERMLLLTLPRITGGDVKRVQTALVAGGFVLNADGVFGKKTAEAVKKFQMQKGLKADGIVGPATMAALGL